MNISKKIRFEVFKRDKFTCQYCGAKAPDVLLHVDHIKPKSKGGEDGIINLITSCKDCNLGKGKRRLSDASLLQKQHKQLSDLQERRNQLEMMLNWSEGLKKLADERFAKVEQKFSDYTGSYFTDVGKKDMRKLVKKFGCFAVLKAIDLAVEKYLPEDAKPYTQESIDNMFYKIGGICYVNQTENPEDLRELYYIRGIIKNRLEGRYYDSGKAIHLLSQAYIAGATLDSLQEFAKNINNWSHFRSEIQDFLSKCDKDNNE